MTYFAQTDLQEVAHIASQLARAPQGPLLSDPLLAGRLSGLFSADFLGTTRWDPRLGRYEDPLCYNRDPAMAREYQAYFQFVDPISPILRQAEQPSSIYQAVPRSCLHRSEYFVDFLQKYQVEDGIDLHLHTGPNIIGDFRVWRAPGRPALAAREIGLLQVLQPYLLNHFLLRTACESLAQSRLTARLRWRSDKLEFSEALEAWILQLPPGLEARVVQQLEQALRGNRPGAKVLGALSAKAVAEDGSGDLQLHMLTDGEGEAPDMGAGAGQFTPREHAVLGQIAQGHSDKEIARKLQISYWTVRTHVGHLLAKTGARRRSELACIAHGGKSAH